MEGMKKKKNRATWMTKLLLFSKNAIVRRKNVLKPCDLANSQ